MAVSVVLSVIAAAAVILVVGAFVLPPILQREALRRRILVRMEQDGWSASDSMSDPVLPLRRDEPGERNFLTAIGTAIANRWSFLGWNTAMLLSVAAGALTALRGGLWPALSVVTGLFVPLVCLRLFQVYQRKRRQAALDAAVPEALEMIVRALRVGRPIGMAIQIASRDLSGPLAEEFREASDRISYGQGIADALRDLAERGHNQNLRFLAAAVAIQNAVGGNLAEVLERLAAVARAREQMRRRIRAMTAEATWSGRFLSAFPLLVAAGLVVISPGYFDQISQKWFFLPMLGVVALLLVLNILFMRRLVRLDPEAT